MLGYTRPLTKEDLETWGICNFRLDTAFGETVSGIALSIVQISTGKIVTGIIVEAIEVEIRGPVGKFGGNQIREPIGNRAKPYRLKFDNIRFLKLEPAPHKSLHLLDGKETVVLTESVIPL